MESAMNLRVRKAPTHPPLSTFQEARSHRQADRLRDRLKPKIRALSEAIVKQDQVHRVDHQSEVAGDVVVTDHGFSYSETSPDSEKIKWSPITTNIEAARVRYRPEDGLLLSADIEENDTVYTFVANPNENVYGVETLTESFVVRENVDTGALILEYPKGDV